MFAWRLTHGDRPLFDAVDRPAGSAVEDEQEARLADRRDRGDGPVAAAHVKQRRRRRIVAVPDVVMDQLEMPELLAGAGIERDEAGGGEVRAAAVPAIAIPIGRVSRHEDDAALRIDAEQAP